MPRRLVFHPNYSVPLPDGHRFPMPKFAHLHAYLRAAGLADDAVLVEAAPADATLLRLAHDADYVDAVLAARLSPDAERRLGLPMTAAVAARASAASGGTLTAARLALKCGFAAN